MASGSQLAIMKWMLGQAFLARLLWLEIWDTRHKEIQSSFFIKESGNSSINNCNPRFFNQKRPWYVLNNCWVPLPLPGGIGLWKQTHFRNIQNKGEKCIWGIGRWLLFKTNICHFLAENWNVGLFTKFDKRRVKNGGLMNKMWTMPTFLTLC